MENKHITKPYFSLYEGPGSTKSFWVGIRIPWIMLTNACHQFLWEELLNVTTIDERQHSGHNLHDEYQHHQHKVLPTTQYTHTQPFYGSGFCLGQPVWAGTRRNIHPLTPNWSSIIPYLFPLPITIHGIFPVQFTCLTVFFHNRSPSFIWSTSWPGTLHFTFGETYVF